MGIKNFYKHFKKKFHSSIHSECPSNHEILILELNGIFYDCTKRYLFMKMVEKEKPQILNIDLFHLIGDEIFRIIKKFLPKEKVFLVVDGFAPMMKFKEQFQRRYKNIIYNQYDGLFDLNQYTPGTRFMDFLTKYIDWIIKKKMNDDLETFQHIDIFFSNEKNRGEGEYKSVNFLRKEENHYKTVFIYSNDSDWIHLSLLLPSNLYNLYICRNKYEKYEYIDVNHYKEQLKSFFFDDKDCMISFMDIYIIFLFLGNDYVESFNYFDNIDIIFDTILPLYYQSKVHFIHPESTKLDMKNYIKFIKLCFSKIHYMKDLPKKNVDYNEYRNIFDQFDNIQNLLHMNFNSNFDWNFVNFVSIDCTLIHHIDLEHFVDYCIKPNPSRNDESLDECLFHLMILLPRQSQHFLPKCFHDCPRMEFNKMYFDIEKNKFIFDFKINNLSTVEKFYMNKKNFLSFDEKKRNMEGKIFKYSFNCKKQTFLKSFYGIIKKNKIEVSFVTPEIPLECKI